MSSSSQSHSRADRRIDGGDLSGAIVRRDHRHTRQHCSTAARPHATGSVTRIRPRAGPCLACPAVSAACARCPAINAGCSTHMLAATLRATNRGIRTVSPVIAAPPVNPQSVSGASIPAEPISPFSEYRRDSVTEIERGARPRACTPIPNAARGQNSTELSGKGARPWPGTVIPESSGPGSCGSRIPATLGACRAYPGNGHSAAIARSTDRGSRGSPSHESPAGVSPRLRPPRMRMSSSGLRWRRSSALYRNPSVR